jgi:hypothetical protein
MYQDQAPQHFPDGKRALPAISDTGVDYSLSMKPKEICVMRNQDAPSGSRERQLRGVVGGKQSHFRACGRIDSAPAQSRSYAGGNVLVQVKTNRHSSGSCFDLFLM